MNPQSPPTRGQIILRAALLNVASLLVLVGTPFLIMGWWLKQGNNASGGLVLLPFLLLLLPVVIAGPFLVTRAYLRKNMIAGANKIAMVGAIANFVPLPFFIAGVAGIYLGDYLVQKDQTQKY